MTKQKNKRKNPLTNENILNMIDIIRMTASIYARIPEKAIKQSPNGFQEIEISLINLQNLIKKDK